MSFFLLLTALYVFVWVFWLCLSALRGSGMIPFSGRI